MLNVNDRVAHVGPCPRWSTAKEEVACRKEHVVGRVACREIIPPNVKYEAEIGGCLCCDCTEKELEGIR